MFLSEKQIKDYQTDGAIVIKDILSKSKGSYNPHNVVKATFQALINLRSANKIAAVRGISLEKVFNG